jgi:hypothetical protein
MLALIIKSEPRKLVFGINVYWGDFLTIRKF